MNVNAEDNDNSYEFGEEPNWREEPEPETPVDEFEKNVKDLISKSAVRCTRLQLLVPFAHDPDNKYVGGTIYLDDSHYWRIEGKDQAYGNSQEALYQLAQSIELSRINMINEEFKESGI
jgi:hypothetical protein